MDMENGVFVHINGHMLQPEAIFKKQISISKILYSTFSVFYTTKWDCINLKLICHSKIRENDTKKIE